MPELAPTSTPGRRLPSASGPPLPGEPVRQLPLGQRHPGLRAGAAGTAVVAALGLWLWLGDYTALAAVGYLPIVVFRLLSGSAEGMLLSALWSWPVIRSFLVAVAGLVLLLLADRAWPFGRVFATMSARRLRRATLIQVAVAVAVPTGYAATRLAWAAGIPLGVSAEFLDEMGPLVLNGLGLALGALGGAVLTLGLVRPWGEVWPRWLPGLGGRGVPTRLPVAAALAVSLLIMVAGLFFVRAVLTGAGIVGAPSGADDQVAAWLPELFWPLWSLALAGAALAYRERRSRGAGEAGRP